MGWSKLPKPEKVVNGTQIGACTDEDCGHRDCEQTRKMANTKCDICGIKIGYETPFYKTDEGLVHAECKMEQVE